MLTHGGKAVGDLKDDEIMLNEDHEGGWGDKFGEDDLEATKMLAQINFGSFIKSKI